MLFVMYKMRLYRAHLLAMIMHLFIIQMIYITTFATQISPAPFSDAIYNPYDMVRVGIAYSSSVSGGFVANFISFTLCYVLLSSKAAQPNKYLYYFLCVAPGVALGIPASYSWRKGDWVLFEEVAIAYNAARLCQIIVNMLCVLILYWRVYQMGGIRCCGPKDEEKSKEVYPFLNLASRLVGYPLVGVIQRMGCALFTFYTGTVAMRFPFVADKLASDPDKSVQTAIIMMYIWAVFAPSAILLDSIILLNFQRGAIEVCQYYLYFVANKLTAGWINKKAIPSEIEFDMKQTGENFIDRSLSRFNNFSDETERPRNISIVSEKSESGYLEKLTNRLINDDMDEQERTKLIDDLLPHEIMDVIVRVHQAENVKKRANAGSHGQKNDRNRSISIDSESYRTSGGSFFILDYVFDTSDEPGMPPEDATRNRKASIKSPNANNSSLMRSSINPGSGADDRARAITPSNPMHEL